MARKNLLSNLTPHTDVLPDQAAAAEGQGSAARFGSSRNSGSIGAIGAVSRSIENLQARSVVDLDPEKIDESFITDRLEVSPEQHAALVESIREHKQQVPILVRPHPEREGRFQIAYGRRRLRALRELGLPVRAIVKRLDDKELVVAQGQENSARTDLSFIEKALFARKLEDGGFSREIIMASLSADKSNVSRLIIVARKIPTDIIEAIGPAPKVGRDRWHELADRLDAGAAVVKARNAIEMFGEKDSDARFEAVFLATAPRRAKPAKPDHIRAADGTRLGQVREDAKSVVFAIEKKNAGAFGAYLREHLPEIFAAFKRSEDDVPTSPARKEG